jgi:type I restriction enzyme, S subunit
MTVARVRASTRDKMMRIRADSARADTRFVYYWLRTPAVRAVLEAAASGTSSSMRNITQKDVIGLPFPVDTGLPEQRTAVEELDEIVSRIVDARATQQSAEQDLSALMPALLDRAFRGELDISHVTTAEAA